MADFIVQVITDEVEIAELLFYDREPHYDESRLHPVDGRLPLADAFLLSGLCTSKGDARRLTSQGGAYVQNRRCITDGEFWQSGMIRGRYVLLRKGKKKIALLEMIPVRAKIIRGGVLGHPHGDLDDDREYVCAVEWD